MNNSGRQREYWFPAMRHGFGWGLPSRWQGWAVMVGYLAAMTGAGLIMNGVAEPVGPAIAWTLFVVSTVTLIVICARKGEPPQWRWGNSSPGNPRWNSEAIRLTAVASAEPAIRAGPLSLVALAEPGCIS